MAFTKDFWTPEMRKKAREKALLRWQDPAFRARLIKSQNNRGAWTPIKQLRMFLTESQGWNQGEFAKALGLSGKTQSRMSRLENGLERPSADQIQRMKALAKEYGIEWEFWDY